MFSQGARVERSRQTWNQQFFQSNALHACSLRKTPVQVEARLQFAQQHLPKPVKY